MVMVRQPRTDRRRRIVLRDSADESSQSGGSTARGNKASAANARGDAGAKRGAGYSQDVRRVCGQRLVQLIPVRFRSYLAVMAISLLLPASLLTAHYLIYVNGYLPWYGYPLALALDASHPQSIAGWLSSNLWLMCLAATVLTFQIRRHKLDDYKGEYRLWFWLVLTCLAASMDSTTHVSTLFGLALDRWSQINLGWSGPAVVQATLAVLVGMLGLRLCNELKTVPLSLTFWLFGLVCWAGSAALGQQELKLEMTIQFRIWLRFALWQVGLTCVWLASLTYLRTVYIEAQQRFLLRGRLAVAPGLPIRERIRESMPEFKMPAWRRSANIEQDDADETANAKPNRKRRNPDNSTERQTSDEYAPQAAVATDASRSTNQEQRSTTQSSNASQNSSSGKQPISSNTSKSVADGAVATAASGGKLSRLTGWLRKPKDGDEASEFQKVPRKTKQAKSQPNEQETAHERDDNNEDPDQTTKRGWVPKFKRPSVPKLSVPKVSMPKFPKFKLPSFGLGSLRLKPPKEEDSDQGSTDSIQKVAKQKPLPSTAKTNNQNTSATNSASSNNVASNNASTRRDDSQGYEDDNYDDDGRPLSKAERKRLRRQRQQQNRAA